MRRIVLLLLGLVGLGLLLAAPASAHATVTSSTPSDGSRLAAAPKSVDIVFDESVSIGSVGYLHVTNQTGARVDTGDTTQPGGQDNVHVDLKSGIGDGTYTASFRIVSADSHPVAGTIRFVVGNGELVRGSVAESGGNGVSGILLDIVRWVSYAGFAVLGGAWLLLTVWPQGRDDRRARRLVWGGWIAVGAGGALELLLQGPYSAGLGPQHLFDSALLDNTLHTGFGSLHSARLLLLGLLGLLFALSLRVDARRAPWEGIAGLIGIGIAATFSAAGHAGTTAPATLSIVVDMLHLLAMAAWVGALVMLIGAVLPRREPDELRPVVPVVSTVALVSVVVLAASGSYNAWRGVGTVDAIFTTTYGLLVVAKVVLFLGVLAVAYVSRRAVQRRFVRPVLAYANTDADTDADSSVDEAEHDFEIERLRRGVFVETAIIAVVLALTAVLVSTPRGKEDLAAQYRDPVSTSVRLGGGRTLLLTADSGTRGNIGLTVEVEGGTAPQSITATALQPKQDIGPLPITFKRTSGRVYDGSVALPVAGPWRFSFTVTTSEFDAVTADGTLTFH